MITLCTVTYDFFGVYERILFDFLTTRSTLVSEVVLVQLDKDDCDHEYGIKTATGRSITVKRVGHCLERRHPELSPIAREFGQAIGLHTAIKHATQECVLFQDLDTFWYSAVDQFYYDLIQNYSLNFVGVSHYMALDFCYLYFPTVISMMAKRKSLPPDDWLKGKLFAKPCWEDIYAGWELSTPDQWVAMDGYWLLQGCLLQYRHRFPNTKKTAIFDIGCNLWLWTQEQGSRWLAFQTLDHHTYNKRICRGSFKVMDKMPNEPFLYHLTNGYQQAAKIHDYQRLYEDTKKNDNNMCGCPEGFEALRGDILGEHRSVYQAYNRSDPCPK